VRANPGHTGFYDFTYGYFGTYTLDGDVLELTMSGFHGESLNMTVKVQSARESLQLLWQTAPPPYWQFQEIGWWSYTMTESKWDDRMRWHNDGPDTQDVLLPIGEGRFDGTVSFDFRYDSTVPDFFVNTVNGPKVDAPLVRPTVFNVPSRCKVTSDLGLNIRADCGTQYPFTKNFVIGKDVVVTLVGFVEGNDDWVFVEYYAENDLQEYSQKYEYYMYGWVALQHLQHL